MINARFQVVCPEICGLMGSARTWSGVFSMAQRHNTCLGVVIHDVMAKPRRPDTWTREGKMIARRADPQPRRAT